MYVNIKGGDILKQKDDVVVYGNELNKARFSGFTATDMDLFMSLCVLAKDQDTKMIEIDFCELRKLTNFRSCTIEEFYKQLNCLRDKIFSMTMMYETEDEEIAFVLFPTYRTNKKEKKLKIAVNEEFKFVLNQLGSSFTMFDLKIFASIKGKYAKTLYRMLAQYRQKNGNGWWQVEINEFKRIFDVPESYKNKYIIEKVVNPALQGIKDLYETLVCEPQYARKKGKPLIGFRFEFTKKIKNDTIAILPEPKEKQPKKKQQPEKQKRLTKSNQFNNFEQRNYTKEQIKDMEKILCKKSLGNSRKMTDSEKQEFETLTKNCTQSNIDDYLPKK